jgi:cell division initiation protein
MFVTPGQVQHHELKSRLGAYDRDSVDELLGHVASSYQEVWRERDALRSRVEELEAESARYQELERLLRDTLVTGQRAAEEVKSEAQQQAEAILEDARAKADEILTDAQRERERVTAEISRLRSVEHDAQERVRGILVGALEALGNGAPEAPQADTVTGNQLVGRPS